MLYHLNVTNEVYVFPIQVIGDLDDLQEWFGEQEKNLLDAEPISCQPSKLHSQHLEAKVLVILITKSIIMKLSCRFNNSFLMGNC